MSFAVRLTEAADVDLLELFDFVLQRELARNGDLDLAVRALDAIRANLTLPERSPFSCRKAGTHPLVRELVIPFGRAGYVALFEIVDDRQVVVTAVRHQREDDYH